MLIFLIGYMGCGKSTIGRKLSARMECDLIDTDQAIERSEGMSVAEIFECKGEEYFRVLEQKLLTELVKRKGDCIVSTGGGLPMWGDNMATMRRAGRTVYLYRTPESILGRMSDRGRAKRPKLRGLSDEEVLAYMRENIAIRDGVYRTADLVVNVVPMGDSHIVKLLRAYIAEK